MNEQELKQLDNEIVETKKQLVLIDKTIKVLNDIKGMSPIVREGCKENINELKGLTKDASNSRIEYRK